tara:strand:+ start:592 stop:765 length:174 start_codon:yes stop_codon:yes gene_type:complete
MKKLDNALGRSNTAHSSSKSIVREIGATKATKLSIKQCRRLLTAVATRLEELENDSN